MAQKFSKRQLQLIAEATRRVNSTPRGRPRGQGTHHISQTNGWLAVLDAELSYDESASPSTWKAAFTRWAPTDPNNDNSAYEALDDITVYCWGNWHLKDGESLPSGTRITVLWVAGRWHVIDANACPDEE